MATAFSFTNVEESSSNSLHGISLDLKDNYVLKKEDPDEVIIGNTTAALDQPENISYRFQNIEHVTGPVKPAYPAPNNSGVKYNVRIDNVLRETLDSGVIIDHPISIQLTVMHELSSAITNEIVTTEFQRLMGAIWNKSASKYRFMEMARGAIQPTTN